jgi:hypothetical protein
MAIAYDPLGVFDCRVLMWQQNCLSVSMKLSGLVFKLSAGVVCSLIACSTPDHTSQREVIRDTRAKRSYPIILSAKDGNMFFNLHENNFFEFYGVKLGGIAKGAYYAGTYEREGDSLFLAFHNKYQPADLTTKGLIDKENNSLILFSTDTSMNRKMQLTTNNY